MFGVTAGYHRYFSHRSFETSRSFAFLLGVLAESSAKPRYDAVWRQRMLRAT